MSGAVNWVDEVCSELQLVGASVWLPWNRREGDAALAAGREGQGTPGVYLIGWGETIDDLEIVYVGEASDLRTRLRHLEDHVKWGIEHGFAPLRGLIEEYGDHRTMKQVWVRLLPVEEEALFPSSLLTDRRRNALGSKRRQLETVLLAEYYCRFESKVPGNKHARGLFLQDLTRRPAPVITASATNTERRIAEMPGSC